ncbi:hypothetical protein OAU25_03240 [Crocinitomicaceae bacterium]|nr:hypothetical protein [Crocinitomicaceae bacterium]
MKILILTLALLCYHAASSQLHDGAHFFTNDDIRVDVYLSEDGWTIESVKVLNRKTGETEQGVGLYNKVNMNGVDENYDGPNGFYIFETEYCLYNFDAPIEAGGNITLSVFDCKNNVKDNEFKLTHMYEAEMAMYEAEIMEADTLSTNPKQETTILESEAEEYFTKFLDKEGDELAEVFLEHQPSVSDCKYFFNKENYLNAYKGITAGFGEIAEQIEIQNERFKGLKFCRASEFNTTDIIKDNCSVCPGTAKYLKDMVNPDIICFSMEFLKSKESEFGSRYALFTKIGERWVYFPIN